MAQWDPASAVQPPHLASPPHTQSSLGPRPAELTGAMGVRTVHQQEAKAQLLVAVGRQPGNPWTAAQAAGALPDQAEPQAELEAAAHEKVRGQSPALW